MKDKKMYIIIAFVIIFIIVGIVKFVNFALREKGENFEIIEDSEISNLVGETKENKVKGYHLVTYNQSSNTNSFIRYLKVNASSSGKVRFAIGSINDDNTVQERTSFEVECENGENTFDLQKERHFIKKGEYLFMDIYGQDTLFTKENLETSVLLQNENNKKSGKMVLEEGNYILPFEYTLQEAKDYNVLVIGNDITVNGKVGLNATDSEHDYYSITEKRFLNIFENLRMNRINAKQWEKDSVNRNDWITKNLNEKVVSDLDLVIFQLGENFNSNDDFEKEITNLVKIIEKYSPNAELVSLGTWSTQNKLFNRIPTICEKLNLEYVEIGDLSEEVDYKSYLEGDNTFDVSYPNNEAMQVISNRLMEVLKYEI